MGAFNRTFVLGLGMACTSLEDRVVEPIQSEGPVHYTVEPGDTLSSIAARFGDTVKGIQERNGLVNPNALNPGESLELEVKSSREKIVNATSVPEFEANDYVVKINGQWEKDLTHTKEGSDAFPQRWWLSHPTWDETYLKTRERDFYEKPHPLAGQAIVMGDVEAIILHSTICELIKPECIFKEQKAHFAVDQKGEIFYIVPIAYRAAFRDGDGYAPHAGVSNWNGLGALNHSAIGIEVEAGERELWTSAEYDSVRDLVAWLGGYFELEKRDVLRHAQVAYSTDTGRGRKSDPLSPPDFWERLDLPPNDWIFDWSLAQDMVPNKGPVSKEIFGTPWGVQAAVDLKPEQNESR